MTKAEIVTGVSKETGVDKTTALTVVESFMEQVKAALAADENVYLNLYIWKILPSLPGLS